jgi:hypothetical protein
VDKLITRWNDLEIFAVVYCCCFASMIVTPCVYLQVKAGADPFADPWTAERAEKKARVDKNQKNELNNKLKAAGKPIRRAGRASFGNNFSRISVPGLILIPVLNVCRSCKDSRHSS